MRQTFSALAVAVAAGTLLLAGCSGNNAQAQSNGGGPGGANPQMRQAMEQARDTAKTSAMNDLSPDHRAQVQKIADAVNAGTDSDLAGAVKQVDAILTPDESKAVLGERDKMAAAMRAAYQQNGGQAGAGGANGGRRGAGGMMRSNDPGRFLLMVNLSRERLRALRQAQQQQPQSN